MSSSITQVRGTDFAQTIILSALIAEIANTRPSPIEFVSELRRTVDASVEGMGYAQIERGSQEDLDLRQAARAAVSDVFSNFMKA